VVAAHVQIATGVVDIAGNIGWINTILGEEVQQEPLVQEHTSRDGRRCPRRKPRNDTPQHGPSENEGDKRDPKCGYVETSILGVTRNPF